MRSALYTYYVPDGTLSGEWACVLGCGWVGVYILFPPSLPTKNPDKTFMKLRLGESFHADINTIPTHLGNIGQSALQEHN